MEAQQLESRTITFPAKDLRLLKLLAKKCGWKVSRKKKCGLDRSIDDIKAGRVREITDIHEYLKQLGADV